MTLIERHTIVTWYTPKEKLPEEGVIVVASISWERKNVRYDHAFALCEWYKDKRGWYLTEDVELDDFTVHAWCDLEPYGGGPA